MHSNPTEVTMKLELYFSPGSCPRVSMIALEETGVPFTTHLVAFMAGDHRKPEFLARNPSGKVPVLLVDEQPIVQTVAILGFLNETFPEARLFPALGSPLAVWLSAAAGHSRAAAACSEAQQANRRRVRVGGPAVLRRPRAVSRFEPAARAHREFARSTRVVEAVIGARSRAIGGAGLSRAMSWPARSAR